MIVVSDCHYDGASVMNPSAPVAATRPDCEYELIRSGGGVAFDRDYLFAQRDAQLVSVGDTPVIAQSLHASGFVVRGGKGEGADFQQLGRGEKNHVPWEMKDRIHQYSLFKH